MPERADEIVVTILLFEVAEAAGGVVQGDKGEYYDASGNPIRSLSEIEMGKFAIAAH